jgi:cytochrome P450
MTTTDAAPPSIPIKHGYVHTQAPELLADPFLTWHSYAQESQAFGSDVGDGWNIWFPLRAAEIKKVLQTPTLFSSHTITPYGPESSEIMMIPEQLDPPEHGKYRQLLTAHFSPQRIAGMEPEIRAWCIELIERLRDKGGADVDAEFGRLFPTMIFLRLMGLPAEGADEFLGWVNNVMRVQAMTEEGAALSEDDMAAAGGAFQRLMAYMATVIDERRTEPQDDIVSYLLSCQVDGRPLSDDELRMMCFLLYIAGLDTVAGELSYAFLHLANHPEHREMVTRHPETIPAFLEEILRLNGIVTTTRLVTQDVEFAGCPMKRGDRVVLATAAANVDPAEFDDPLTFDPARAANRHITFGAGPHRCLGSHLARLELRVAIEEWHKRIPDYRVDPGAVIEHRVGGVGGLRGLPLVWD